MYALPCASRSKVGVLANEGRIALRFALLYARVPHRTTFKSDLYQIQHIMNDNNTTSMLTQSPLSLLLHRLHPLPRRSLEFQLTHRFCQSISASTSLTIRSRARRTLTSPIIFAAFLIRPRLVDRSEHSMSCIATCPFTCASLSRRMAAIVTSVPTA